MEPAKNETNETIERIPAWYRIIDRFKFLQKIARLGGIRFKWATVIFFIIVIVTIIFGLMFFIMSSNALLKANDKLCQTIAENISATEPILVTEKEPYKRAFILQDVVNRLSQSDIPGLKYAAVYDLEGKLTDKEITYAAHTVSSKQGKWIPRKIYPELKKVKEFNKERILIEDKGKLVPCYQYRMPYTFFDVPVGVIEIVFTEESIFAPIKRMALYTAFFAAGLLVFSIFLSTKVAGGLVRPIRKLARGMHKVRDGLLETKINIYRHDELGDLSIEFNNMVTHLKEKLHMQKFVSESTISMIRQSSDSDSEIHLGGTRQNLAFLFADVRGFTAMSEKIAPEEVVKILNKYLDLQAQIIKANNGDIDKFVGDEIMAFFSGRSKADNAINAAIEIRRQVSLLNKERKAKGLRTLEVGIGLNIGDVVHGRMGSRDRMDNTSIGDAVNLAARLCSNAKGGEILASENIVKRASKNKYAGKKLSPLTVKGKAKPIQVYSISSQKK